MNIDDMSPEQIADYATCSAADSDWNRLIAAIERGGPDRACSALAGGEFGVWNEYEGSSRITGYEMTVVDGGVRVTAEGPGGRAYAATIAMKIPRDPWAREAC